MAYADQQMSGNRVVAIIVVALLHVAIGYTLVTGLAYEAAKSVVERVTTIDVEEPEPEEEEPEPPPPEEIPDTAPPPMVVPPPRFNNTDNTARDTTQDPLPRRTEATRQATTKTCNGQQIPIGAVCGPPPPEDVGCWDGSRAPTQAQCPPQGVEPKSATPRNDRNRWVTTNDYPSSSLRREEEGVTSVRLTVGANGRVSNCSVTSSSGHSRLDDTTCRYMQRRARFNAATDRQGNATTGSYDMSVRWEIPE